MALQGFHDAAAAFRLQPRPVALGAPGDPPEQRDQPPGPGWHHHGRGGLQRCLCPPGDGEPGEVFTFGRLPARQGGLQRRRPRQIGPEPTFVSPDAK